MAGPHTYMIRVTLVLVVTPLEVCIHVFGGNYLNFMWSHFCSCAKKG